MKKTLNGIKTFLSAVLGLLCIILGLTVQAQSPSSDQNYVKETTVRIPGIIYDYQLSGLTAGQANQKINYIDGLGRPLQTVNWQASPTGADLVQPVAYDAYGREVKKYLPYTTGSNAAYKAAALSDVLSYYNSPPGGVVSTASPFAETKFEPSPLNRVEEQGSPGDAWQLSGGHVQKIEYGSSGNDAIQVWTVNSSGATVTGTYGTNSLYKNRSIDENGNSTWEYKDKDGRLIRKVSEEPANTYIATFYIYDDLGNLRYVLPPGANPDALSSFTESDAVFHQFIYAYHYDGRKRVIEKKIPGKGWENTVYNMMDLPVMVQDANQASLTDPNFGPGPYHTFYKYDALGRMIISGVERNRTAGRQAIQDVVDAYADRWEYRDYYGFWGYTNYSIPRNTSDFDVRTVNYYDNYNIPNLPYNESASYSDKTKGLLTASVTKVLGTSTYLWTLYYYDDEGRVVRTKSQNHLSGTDDVFNTWSFSGELTNTTRNHTSNAGSVTIANRYTYDHAGRKTASYQQMNSDAEVQLSANTYNEIGQLYGKTMHNGLQSSLYSYNPRGWLKMLNAQMNSSSLFDMLLNYETGHVPRYNGDITDQFWGTGGNYNTYYDYRYDKLNRLTNGYSNNGYGEDITYDAMGNIQSLARGNYGTNTYTNTGNQLSSISGVINGSYSYDPNGNMTADARGYSIGYNDLNLPKSISGGGGTINYTYNAAGEKLIKYNATTTATSDYVSGIHYTGGSIEFVQTQEGLARRNGSSYSYEYNLKDHLGNTRRVFYQNPSTSQMQILQSEDYYPFGMRRNPGTTLTKYLYNGKEVQDDYGLGQYDYGARFYDPVIGRWTTVDPSAEHPEQIHLSPYNYGLNNPVKNIDPDGKCVPCLIEAAVALYEGLTAAEVATAVVATGGAAIVVNSARNYSNRNSDVAVRDNTTVVNDKPSSKPIAPSPAKLDSRGKNLEPNKDAGGDHSSIKRDPSGKITNTATYKKNPQNPTGFDEEKRVDVEGGAHYDKKTGKSIPTPHVHEGKDTRPAKPEELPEKKKTP